MYKNDRSKDEQMQGIFEFLLRGRKIGGKYPLDDELITKIPDGNDLLFSLSTPTVRRHFTLLLKSLDSPQIHVHDIRHMTATISLESGVPIADVSIGHKDIANLYR